MEIIPQEIKNADILAGDLNNMSKENEDIDADKKRNKKRNFRKNINIM